MNPLSRARRVHWSVHCSSGGRLFPSASWHARPPFFLVTTPDYDGPHQVESAGGPITDFDWAGLERLLGEIESAPDEQQRIADSLGVLLEWCTEGRLCPSAVGSRFLSICWVFGIGGLADSSLRRLAVDAGISAPLLARLNSRVSRRTGYWNGAQRAAIGFGTTSAELATVRNL